METIGKLSIQVESQKFAKSSKKSAQRDFETFKFAESYDEFSSCFRPENYINRITRIERNPLLFKSLCLPVPPKANLLDRISRRRIELRKLYSEKYPIKLRDGIFSCPRILKPFSNSMISKKINQTQTPIKGIHYVNKTKEGINRRFNSGLLLDRLMDINSVAIEKKKCPINCVNPIKPKEETHTTQVKIIVENEGILKTKSGKEIMKEYNMEFNKRPVFGITWIV